MAEAKIEEKPKPKEKPEEKKEDLPKCSTASHYS